MSTRLSHEASSFLDQVREAEDPTQEDEERVKRALDAALAAGVTCHWQRHAVQEPASGPAAPDLVSAGASAAKASAAWVAPLGVVALCAAALFTAGDDEPGSHALVAPPSAAAPSAAVPSAAVPSAVPPGATPGQSSGSQNTPVDSGQRGALPAVVREATAADAGAPTAAGASSAAASRPKVSSRDSAALAKRRASSALAAELALLQRAQAALRRGDGARALHELDGLPGTGGQLLAERHTARVLALCSLGRISEAQALAEAIVRADPDSVQTAALERSCANPSRNRGR